MFAGLIAHENSSQNLVSRGSIPELWSRHILDSAQVVQHAPQGDGLWLDVGTGAGLPGIVLAILTKADHLLVEPRRLRAGFLRQAIQKLGLSSRVEVAESKVEALTGAGRFDVITARAFACLDATLAATAAHADARTVWLLHKGRSYAGEMDEARGNWDARFESIASRTDPEGRIVRVSELRGRVQE